MTTEPTIADQLALALQLADRADEIAMRHFRSQSLVVESKADHTEVTLADRDTETAIRNGLLEARPGDGILGEEHGTIASQSGSQWIIDPIDGTSNYVRGVPMWATLIARETNGVLDLGVVSAPAMGLRWWAGRGLGAFADGRPIRVSSVNDPTQAYLSYSEGPWAATGRRQAIDDLRNSAGRQRAFGDFWQHMLVAEGAIDIATEAIVSLWDLAAIQILVEEAGGRFTDLDGIAQPGGGSALSTNGLLHDRVLQALRPRADPN